MRRYYLADSQGTIRFTPIGLRVLKPIFSKSGIDISLIRTRRQYIDARLRVRPVFLEEKWFQQTPSEDQRPIPQSQEHKLLMDAVFGDHSPEEFQRMITKLQKRPLFTVIDGNR